MTLNPQLGDLLKVLVEGVVESAPLWTETLNALDSGCGDGDCGSTLQNGAQGEKISVSTTYLKLCAFPFNKNYM